MIGKDKSSIHSVVCRYHNTKQILKKVLSFRQSKRKVIWRCKDISVWFHKN